MKHCLLSVSLLAVSLLSLFPARAAASFEYLSEVRYRLGDESGWQDSQFDDRDWQHGLFSQIPGGDEVLWIRGEFQVTAALRPAGEPLGLLVSNLATCEVYWDSELLPGRGRVGTSPEDEIPGTIQYLVQVPDRLATLGEHTIALRCSTHHRHFEPTTGFWIVGIGPYGPLAVTTTDYSWKALVSLSGMLILGIFFLVQFALQRSDRSHLFLGLFCWVGAALLIAESWRSLFPYTYNWHLLRLAIITGLAWLLSLLLITFLVIRFRFHHRGPLILLAGAVASTPVLLFKSWDGKVIFMLFAIFSLGLILAALALRRGEHGSGFAALGLVLGLFPGLVAPDTFGGQTLFLGLDLLIACLLVSYAVQARRTRKQRQAAELKSARLEIELLKRTLQPHFLMNTLTALAEWFEEEPAVASQMIQALAEELRLLSAISSQTLIPMQEELSLCRCHLEIMSHRQGCRFRLLADGVDPQARIPPAVIHTLVENAITHNHYRAPEIDFRLHQKQQGAMLKWTFQAPLGAVLVDDPNQQDANRQDANRQGTGLRYIRARLDEAFGTAARLHQERRGDDWLSEILVPSTTGIGSG